MQGRKVFVAVLSFAFVVIMFLGNFVFLLGNSPFYSSEFNKLGVNSTAAFSVTGFVTGKAPLPPYFTNSESSHLKDVKSLFSGVRFAYYSAILLLGIAIALLVKRGLFSSVMPASLTASGAFSLLLLLVIFLSSINFSSFFSIIHRPFFASGSWVFPEDSLLVSLFPERFFHDFANNLFRLILVNAAVFLGIGLFIRKKFKRNLKR
ncbi:DUF1461 domain-containing protein [Candidatus Woesearchaeota archaeon]|nr:DUF1461 domain-containing protein [Candidatus Woesearchaeota archaeon]